MGFAFEVRETDLLGRIGTLEVGGKSVETPYMFPVIHPVNQSVSPSELTEMGYNGLMTNSYIIWSRRREEALSKRIHALLGFDGVFMTDSGGYQVLEYGNVEVDYSEMARFQAKLGSEIAVTLDRPTGYPQSRAVANETMEYSLKNAKATLEEFGGERTTWVGPIQGGLHLDLVKRSATSMIDSGFQFLALGSPVQVMENYMYADLVKMIVAAKKAIPYSVPLHLFGAGHPFTMPMAVALGCDTFDSASYALFARSGRYMTRSGVLTLTDMQYLPCSCGVCLKNTVKGLLELDHKERTRRLSLHNLYILREEVEACKEALHEGRLWDLVEERSLSHPRLREAFVELSKHSEYLAEGTPLLKDRGLLLRSREDLVRPEILNSRKRLGVERKAAKRAALADASDLSPVSSGNKKRDPAEEDVYRVHPALGLYPAELEFVFPFTQTTNVGGLESQELLRDAKRRLKKMGYRAVRTTTAAELRSKRSRSRRSRRGASPSLPSSSARPR